MKKYLQNKINWQLYLLIVFIILLDQVTKTWAHLKLQGSDTFHPLRDLIIMKGVFRFTYTENPGMAFGIRVGNELFLTLFATIACVLLLWVIYKSTIYSNIYKYALGAILGGAIGNLIDRVIYGKVIDFIYIEIINWPVFNIADIAVTFGMILGILQIFLTPTDMPNTEIEKEQDIWVNGEKIPSDKVIQ